MSTKLQEATLIKIHLNDGSMKSLLRDTRGAVLAEYSVVLLVLSVAIWCVIVGLTVAIVNHIDSVASNSGVAAASNLPSMNAPDFAP